MLQPRPRHGFHVMCQDPLEEEAGEMRNEALALRRSTRADRTFRWHMFDVLFVMSDKQLPRKEMCTQGFLSGKNTLGRHFTSLPQLCHHRVGRTYREVQLMIDSDISRQGSRVPYGYRMLQVSLLELKVQEGSRRLSWIFPVYLNVWGLQNHMGGCLKLWAIDTGKLGTCSTGRWIAWPSKTHQTDSNKTTLLQKDLTRPAINAAINCSTKQLLIHRQMRECFKIFKGPKARSKMVNPWTMFHHVSFAKGVFGCRDSKGPQLQITLWHVCRMSRVPLQRNSLIRGIHHFLTSEGAETTQVLSEVNLTSLGSKKNPLTPGLRRRLVLGPKPERLLRIGGNWSVFSQAPPGFEAFPCLRIRTDLGATGMKGYSGERYGNSTSKTHFWLLCNELLSLFFGVDELKTFWNSRHTVFW